MNRVRNYDYSENTVLIGAEDNVKLNTELNIKMSI